MKTVKAVFKNGVFVPAEPISLNEGAEAIVVYVENAHENFPKWWNEIPVDERKKEALKLFSEKLSVVSIVDIKVNVNDGEMEVFVLVQDEREAVKPVMEAGMRVYEETGVYVPIQVISERRLNRWKEQGNKIYQSIKEGVSIK